MKLIANFRSKYLDANFSQQSSGTKPAPTDAQRMKCSRTHPPPPPDKRKRKASILYNVEVISSDDGEHVFQNKHVGTNEPAKSHARKQRRRQTRDHPESRCFQHSKRFCSDCNPAELVAKHKREKHQNQRHDDRTSNKSGTYHYSSESEDDLLRNREEIRMALNMCDESEKESEGERVRNRKNLRMALNLHGHNEKAGGKRSLSHKLSVLADGAQHGAPHGEQKRPKRRKSLSDNVPRGKSSDRKERHVAESGAKNRKDTDNKCRKRLRSVEGVGHGASNDTEDMSLEEQELRLIALKSAVLKKHEQRKKKQVTENIPVVRAYSPTDSVFMADDMEQSNDCVDSDNNNMDISPISSPAEPENQHVDMDLVTSNDDSKSPEYLFAEKSVQFSHPSYADWGAYAMPIALNAAYLDPMHAFAAAHQQMPLLVEPPPINMPHPIESDFGTSNRAGNIIESEGTAVESEHELRAQLIVQLRNNSPMHPPQNNESNEIEIEPAESKPNEQSAISADMFKLHDDSLEEDCLRSLLLSARGKKIKVSSKETSKNPIANQDTDQSNLTANVKDTCDDMPKMMSNLRGALKRLREKGHNKNEPNADIVSEAEPNGLTDGANAQMTEVVEQEMLHKEVEAISDVCDQMKLEKTVDNSLLDNNENKVCVVEATASPQQPVIEAGTDECSTKTDGTNSVVVTDAIEKLTPIEPILAPLAPIKQQITASIQQKAVKTPSTVDTKVSVNEIKRPIIKAIPSKIPMVIKSTMTSAFVRTDLLRKNTASPILSGWTPKPVKKLIICLNEDSTTDTDEYMSDAPSSSRTAIQTTSGEAKNSGFELSLDMFLNKVRANTESVKPTQASQTSATKPSTSNAKEPKRISTTSIPKKVSNVQVN